jgi:hypothetical protein
MAKITKKFPSLEQVNIKLQVSQAVLQAKITLEKQQESLRSTVSQQPPVHLSIRLAPYPKV